MLDPDGPSGKGVRARLRELIEDAEAEIGPADAAAVEAKRALLRRGAAKAADAA
ncbi:hypothetical protein [Streptomyces omiyaensis]|uniref:Uncharacterized protein n=1 Tax=Streptomyces omiyaensis TaxID=68247 RepID=A0ABW7BYU3_9ACTN|nr:hypothetical protein [Streptomyces omiyaensis]GGY69429.1 hypothetical protein GCM10010363_58340 [Streptomyces omiyaensis]